MTDFHASTDYKQPFLMHDTGEWRRNGLSLHLVFDPKIKRYAVELSGL